MSLPRFWLALIVVSSLFSGFSTSAPALAGCSGTYQCGTWSAWTCPPGCNKDPDCGCTRTCDGTGSTVYCSPNWEQTLCESDGSSRCSGFNECPYDWNCTWPTPTPTPASTPTPTPAPGTCNDNYCNASRRCIATTGNPLCENGTCSCYSLDCTRDDECSLTPSDPTGLTASCPSPGNSATVSWSAVAGATTYALRVNDDGDWKADCGVTQFPGDICIDTLTTSSYTFSTTPGHSFSWWVHSVNANGWSNGAGGPAFTCVAPTPTPTPTPIPFPAWFQTSGGDVHANGSLGTTIPTTCADCYFSLEI